MSCTTMTISNLDDTLHQILLPLVGRGGGRAIFQLVVDSTRLEIERTEPPDAHF